MLVDSKNRMWDRGLSQLYHNKIESEKKIDFDQLNKLVEMRNKISTANQPGGRKAGADTNMKSTAFMTSSASAWAGATARAHY